MKQRTKFVIGGIVILAALSILSFRGLQEMTVFFYTPAEVLASPADFQDQTIRIGALVQSGSVVWNADEIRLSFDITEDGKEFIPVVYQGVKPDMFSKAREWSSMGKCREEISEPISCWSNIAKNTPSKRGIKNKRKTTTSRSSTSSLPSSKPFRLRRPHQSVSIP